jgi:heterodisulfide reductase subunit D
MRLGDRGNFNLIKKKNFEKLKATGAKKIITACSGCFSTLKHEYSDVLDAEILHLAQFMDNLLAEGKLKFKKEIPLHVTYHDPCHLGRYNGVYDAPRNLIRSIPGIKFTEMERIKHYSFCCGAGAGVKTAFPDVALWTATRRVEEARDTGADTILSCCPFCEQNLLQAAQPAGMDVLDLMWVLNNALGLPEV